MDNSNTKKNSGDAPVLEAQGYRSLSLPKEGNTPSFDHPRLQERQGHARHARLGRVWDDEKGFARLYGTEKNLHASVPPALLAQAEKAAQRQHISLDELVSDAVEQRVCLRKATRPETRVEARRRGRCNRRCSLPSRAAQIVFRVAPDTNIHVSAFNFGGVPEPFLRVAEAGIFQVVTSDAILAELTNVLRGEEFLWPDEESASHCANSRASPSTSGQRVR